MNDETNQNMYSIGEVSRRVGVHDQTIRMYERKGLLHPARTPKGIRKFTDLDVIRITAIITLTQELGMNFNGVRIVMEMAKRIQMSPDELLDFIDDHMNATHGRG